MSEEITEQEVDQVVDQQPAETSQEESREERFAAALEGRARDEQGRFASTTEQLPADEPSPQEEVAAEPAKVSEGPSPDLLAAAQAVLPEEIVGQASSDAELLWALKMAKKFQAEPENEPPAAEQEPDFSLEWPDEDVPKDDPYRQQIERMLSHFQERDKHREEKLKVIAEWAMTKEQREADAREEAAQQQFDELLDKSAIDGFGKSDSLSPKSPEWQKRNAAYGEYAALTTQLGYTPEQAMQAIALKHGKSVPQQPPTPTGSLLKQSKSRLGGASSRPAPAPTLSREDRFAEAIGSLN